MTESDDELAETRRQMAQGQPGGSASRGPKSDPGGDTEVGGLVPPYDRTDSDAAQADAQEGARKAFRAEEYGGEPGPTPPVSKEEREGVPPTDTTAATPLGVGESTRASGEELSGKEAGRHDTGTQGQTERPTGTSTAEDTTGVNPSSGTTQEPSDSATRED
jgi:hypothetical protein